MLVLVRVLYLYLKITSMSEQIIKCPFCAEEISSEAKKCKHCGEFLSGEPKPVQKENETPSNASAFLMRTIGVVLIIGVALFLLAVIVSIVAN